MASDIFSRTIGFGGAFSADGAVISFGANMGAGMLAQSISWQYMQNIQRLYELGSSNVFLVAGRTSGQASVQRIMGPTAIASSFYTTFGNVCNALTNTIAFQAVAKCGSGGTGQTVNLSLGNCVIQSYGGGVQAEQMVVNEQIALMFLFMTYG